MGFGSRLFEIFSEDDNAALCWAKVASGITFIAFHMYVFWMIHHGTIPTLNEYAESTLKMLAGCSVIIAGKQITQKTPSNTGNDK